MRIATSWGWIGPLVVLLASGPGALRAQDEPPVVKGTLVEAGVGLFWQSRGFDTQFAPVFGVRAAQPLGSTVRAWVDGSATFFDVPSVASADEIERSWIFLTAGAELVSVRAPLDFALAVGGGAGRRDDELPGGVASSPHWTPVLALGLRLRGAVSERFGWKADVGFFQDDIVNELFASEEASGRSHWSVQVGWLVR